MPSVGAWLPAAERKRMLNPEQAREMVLKLEGLVLGKEFHMANNEYIRACILEIVARYVGKEDVKKEMERLELEQKTLDIESHKAQLKIQKLEFKRTVLCNRHEHARRTLESLSKISTSHPESVALKNIAEGASIEMKEVNEAMKLLSDPEIVLDKPK